MAKNFSVKKVGAIIIGDEILSGKREDKHFGKLISLLAVRQMELNWSICLPDEPKLISDVFKSTIAKDDITFCFGGIGATPDDHTRQCVATATNTELELHPEAKKEIESVFGSDAYPNRIIMGHFPKGANIIPNPYNRIPGFSIGTNYFLPGFPVMAWPMIEWVLDNLHLDQQHLIKKDSNSIIVVGAGESHLIELMRDFEKEFPVYKIFSLPTISKGERRIELGVKGDSKGLKEALDFIKRGVSRLGFSWKNNVKS